MDKGGTITTDELIHELNRMNIQIAPELAEAFSREFDEDGDAEIDFAEFSRAIRNMDPDRAEKGAMPTISLHDTQTRSPGVKRSSVLSSGLSSCDRCCLLSWTLCVATARLVVFCSCNDA